MKEGFRKRAHTRIALNRESVRLEGHRDEAARWANDAALLHELEVHRMELAMQNEELKFAQNELQSQVERFAQLFHFAPVGYARLTAEGIVTELNHTGETLLGSPRGNVVERRFAWHIAESDRIAFCHFLNNVLSGGVKTTAEFELDLMPPSSDRPRARLTATRLAGSPPSILLAFEDITAEKRAEELRRASEEAKLAEEQLREADCRKDEFLAVLSHELRTPLSAILMHGQLLQQHGDRGVKRSGEFIERAVRTQTRLVEDLLDVSRVVADKLTLDKRPSNLADAVRGAIRSVELNVRKKKVLLEVDIDPTIPPVLGDPIRLEQAVWNLLVNAVKFTPEGGRVEVQVGKGDAQVSVTVRDNGRGIEPAFLSHVFERFRQADSSHTRTIGGLGLGLSIVKAIVEAHGGTICAESAGLGKGSTFSFAVPLMQASRLIEAASADATLETDVRLEGTRLLVVDDDEDTRETITDVLELAGAQVRRADSAASAMEILEHFEPDLMMCDIAMPREDGLALLGRIRSRWPVRTMRTLALTALAGEGDRARIADAGFDEHLVKPIDADTLLKAISRVLHRAPEATASPSRSTPTGARH